MKRAARTRIQNFFQPIMYDSTQPPASQSGHSTSTVGAIAVGVSANSKVPVRSSICAVLRVSHKTWLPPNCIEKIELQWKTRARRATAVYFSIIFIYLWKKKSPKSNDIHHFDEKICRHFRHRLPRRRKVKLVASAARRVVASPLMRRARRHSKFCRRRS